MMKSSFALFLGVLGSTMGMPSSSWLEKRQLDFSNPVIQAFGIKAFKKEDHPSVFQRKGAKRMTLLYGPFRIRPANQADQDLSNESPMMGFSMDRAGTSWNSITNDFPRDITVLKTNTTIVFEDGSRADLDKGMYLHHLLFFDITKKPDAMTGCEGMANYRFPMSLFMAGSQDIGSGIFTTADGSLNSGYYIGPNDAVAMLGDAVNLRNETRHVYAKADIEYIPGRVPNMMDASIQMTNVGVCNGVGGSFNLPPDMKTFTLNGTAMDVLDDGYLITSRGHLHDGGQDIVVKVNGKEICLSTAEYGGEGSTRKSEDGSVWETIREMTYCPGPIKVKKGDKIDLEARYNFEKHPARKMMDGAMAEEMALVTFFFAKENSQI